MTELRSHYARYDFRPFFTLRKCVAVNSNYFTMSVGFKEIWAAQMIAEKPMLNPLCCRASIRLLVLIVNNY